MRDQARTWGAAPSPKKCSDTRIGFDSDFELCKPVLRPHKNSGRTEILVLLNRDEVSLLEDPSHTSQEKEMTLATLKTILDIAFVLLKIGMTVYELIERWMPVLLG